MQQLFCEIIPETFQCAAVQKLKVDTVTINLRDIGKLWNMPMPEGKRLVVII